MRKNGDKIPPCQSTIRCHKKSWHGWYPSDTWFLMVDDYTSMLAYQQYLHRYYLSLIVSNNCLAINSFVISTLCVTWFLWDSYFLVTCWWRHNSRRSHNDHLVVCCVCFWCLKFIHSLLILLNAIWKLHCLLFVNLALEVYWACTLLFSVALYNFWWSDNNGGNSSYSINGYININECVPAEEQYRGESSVLLG